MPNPANSGPSYPNQYGHHPGYAYYGPATDGQQTSANAFLERGQNSGPGGFYPHIGEAPVRYQETYALLESIGLSKRLPVTPVPITFDWVSEAEAWIQHKKYFVEKYDSTKATTELRVIRNVEFSTYVANREKVTLSCARGSPGDDIDLHKQSDTMRWMHVQRDSPNPDLLEKLVLSCPFIPPDVRPVALNLLGDLFGDPSSNVGKTTSVEDGTVLRYTGLLNNHLGGRVKDTAPVTFFSMPYIDWGTVESEDVTDSPFSRKSLLHNFSGYRINTGRERSQVVQKLPIVSDPRAVHVSQMWCLVVGPGELPYLMLAFNAPTPITNGKEQMF